MKGCCAAFAPTSSPSFASTSAFAAGSAPTVLLLNPLVGALAERIILQHLLGKLVMLGGIALGARVDLARAVQALEFTPSDAPPALGLNRVRKERARAAVGTYLGSLY